MTGPFTDLHCDRQVLLGGSARNRAWRQPTLLLPPYSSPLLLAAHVNFYRVEDVEASRGQEKDQWRRGDREKPCPVIEFCRHTLEWQKLDDVQGYCPREMTDAGNG